MNPQLEEKWESALSRIGKDDLALISTSCYDCARRVYANELFVYKIILTDLDQSSNLRHQTLRGEYETLLKCYNINGVPKVVSYSDSCGIQILVAQRVYGTLLREDSISRCQFTLVLLKLALLLIKLNLRGICHNDTRADNVILGEKGEVYLIDYDQALHANSFKAFYKSFFITAGKGEVMFGFLHLVKKYLKRILPSGIVSLIRLVLGRKPLDNQLPVLPENCSKSAQQLLNAWKIAQGSDASSPGTAHAYYSFDYDNFKFPGERSWAERWSVLSKITSYKDKRILELGCNMALLSTHLLKELKASSALCIDIDAQILEAARHVSAALGVKPEFRQQNLDDPKCWEDEVAAFQPDIVFALNVLNWVQDKGRLMQFLGRFNEVVFEGHDSVEVETFRFKNAGFKKIDLVTMTERNRPVLYCYK